MEEITAFPLGKVAVLDLLTDRERWLVHCPSELHVDHAFAGA